MRECDGAVIAGPDSVLPQPPGQGRSWLVSSVTWGGSHGEARADCSAGQLTEGGQEPEECSRVVGQMEQRAERPHRAGTAQGGGARRITAPSSGCRRRMCETHIPALDVA